MPKITIPLLATMVLWLAPSYAQAATAYATDNLHLRAGPDARYPSVAVLRSGERVELLGCLNGLQWCEVETRDGERGWTAAYYLRTTRGTSRLTIIETKADGGLRIIIYSPHDYWDAHYRRKYFYRDRDKWLGHRPPRGNYNQGHGHDHDDDHHDRPAKPRPVKKVEEPKKYQWQDTVKSPAPNPFNTQGEKNR